MGLTAGFPSRRFAVPANARKVGCAGSGSASGAGAVEGAAVPPDLIAVSVENRDSRFYVIFMNGTWRPIALTRCWLWCWSYWLRISEYLFWLLIIFWCLKVNLDRIG